MLTTALENEDFEALVDPELEKNYVPSEMFRMIEAAAACVRHSAAKRPRMSQVVMCLCGEYFPYSLPYWTSLANSIVVCFFHIRW